MSDGSNTPYFKDRLHLGQNQPLKSAVD